MLHDAMSHVHTTVSSSTAATTIMMRIERVGQEWKAFDWETRQQQYDEVLQAAKESRDLSVTARKQLAEATKQLKRSIKNLQTAASQLEQGNENVQATSQAVEVVSGECRTIVNAYKEEIDTLTRRCKTAETAYSNLVQDLTKLSDPSDLLSVSVEQIELQQEQIQQLLDTIKRLTGEMEKLEQSRGREGATGQTPSVTAALSKKEHEELIELRREVAEYEVEFRSLKNQDITIRKLEARIAELQKSAEEQLHDQLEKAKIDLMETEGRRAAEALEREAALERKLQSLELQLKAERAGREATQEHLLDADEGVSRREAAWEAQRQILIGDTERLREELQVSSRERDELRLKLAALQDKKTNLSASTMTGANVQDLMLERAAYEAEVAELSETTNILREEIRMKEDALNEEKRSSQMKLDALNREKVVLQNNVMLLESQLASSPSPESVERMKRELRILKRLEYNADDIDPETARGDEADDKDLESVLVSKLRRAESDLVVERVGKAGLVQECESLKNALADALKDREEAEKLVSSLERDLAKAIASPTTPDSSKRNTAPIPSFGENPALLESVLDPSVPAPTPLKTPSATVSASEKAEDDHSVATIVMAQRDRLRARCDALEAERDSFKRELQAQVVASESLKADNSKLYEKVRYLQSYNRPTGRQGRTLDRDLDLEALEQRYEASVDPFKQFSKEERQRKFKEMSPMERTVFVVAKTVLATKEMRTALFFYVLILHLLVFVTTYHWSHADQCNPLDYDHFAHLPPNSAEHVREDMKTNEGAH